MLDHIYNRNLFFKIKSKILPEGKTDVNLDVIFVVTQKPSL